MRRGGVVAPGRAGVGALGRAGVGALGRAGVALCWRVVAVALLLGLLGVPGPAQAQFSAIAGGASAAPARNDLPVTFSADRVEYDRDNNLVTATGHVEAWQNDHVMHADKVTIDRATGVMAAYGHVVLMEPDGEILFADYAEMNQGMKDGVLRDMQAILAQNGRLAANGARRTGGEINEMADVVYSTCNLCKTDPSKPPLWQLRADKA
ncbi:MAG TPA: LptA/OstA family protein, partial [Acetobacteraceae bacterium]|nr:LptA/OstA family protein [Acetobacteraceae bacterium]